VEAFMRKTRRAATGLLLVAILTVAAGCGGGKEPPQYKEPDVKFKPLPTPGSPGDGGKGKAAASGAKTD